MRIAVDTLAHEGVVKVEAPRVQEIDGIVILQVDDDFDRLRADATACLGELVKVVGGQKRSLVVPDAALAKLVAFVVRRSRGAVGAEAEGAARLGTREHRAPREPGERHAIHAAAFATKQRHRAVGEERVAELVEQIGVERHRKALTRAEPRLRPLDPHAPLGPWERDTDAFVRGHAELERVEPELAARGVLHLDEARRAEIDLGERKRRDGIGPYLGPRVGQEEQVAGRRGWRAGPAAAPVVARRGRPAAVDERPVATRQPLERVVLLERRDLDAIELLAAFATQEREVLALGRDLERQVQRTLPGGAVRPQEQGLSWFDAHVRERVLAAAILDDVVGEAERPVARVVELDVVVGLAELVHPNAPVGGNDLVEAKIAGERQRLGIERAAADR